MQFAAPVFENVPLGQRVALMELNGQKEPAGHAIRIKAFGQKLPGVQTRQEVLKYCPSRHLLNAKPDFATAISVEFNAHGYMRNSLIGVAEPSFRTD